MEKNDVEFEEILSNINNTIRYINELEELAKRAVADLDEANDRIIELEQEIKDITN